MFHWPKWGTFFKSILSKYKWLAHCIVSNCLPDNLTNITYQTKLLFIQQHNFIHITGKIVLKDHFLHNKLKCNLKYSVQHKFHYQYWKNILHCILNIQYHSIGSFDNLVLNINSHIDLWQYQKHKNLMCISNIEFHYCCIVNNLKCYKDFYNILNCKKLYWVCIHPYKQCSKKCHWEGSSNKIIIGRFECINMSLIRLLLIDIPIYMKYNRH